MKNEKAGPGESMPELPPHGSSCPGGEREAIGFKAQYDKDSRSAFVTVCYGEEDDNPLSKIESRMSEIIQRGRIRIEYLDEPFGNFYRVIWHGYINEMANKYCVMVDAEVVHGLGEVFAEEYGELIRRTI